MKELRLGASGRRADSGQTTLLVIGFATMLIMIITAVINASAAFLQRQGLDNLADGAALHGADLGSTGVYENGLPEVRLDQQATAVRAAVHDYLGATGAFERYPGVHAEVSVDPAAQSVTVVISAPLELPLRVPGAPNRPVIGASSTAAVTIVTDESEPRPLP